MTVDRFDFYAPAVATAVAPPPLPAMQFVVDDNESGLPPRVALGLTAVALLLSFGLGRLADHLSDPSRQLDSQLRLALVLTLTFYVLLGAALAWFCLHRRVGLTWVRGRAVDAVLLGLPLGAAGGALAVTLNSTLAGHLASDPRVELLVGGGGALRVSLALLVTAVLAPLVEETLFRGILGGTLLARGAAPAMWGSALAFSVWHMSPTALRYYVFMGLLLAALWRKRGLVASMTAHAAFNGVLTIAAVVAATGAGHPTQFGQLTFSVPGGWHQAPGSALPDRMVVNGPAGAALAVLVRLNADPTTEQLTAALVASERSTLGLQVVAGSERTVQVPAGEAVEADVQVEGQPGHVLALTAGGATYRLIVVTGGSPAAERDWQRIVRTVASTTG